MELTKKLICTKCKKEIKNCAECSLNNKIVCRDCYIKVMDKIPLKDLELPNFKNVFN